MTDAFIDRIKPIKVWSSVYQNQSPRKDTCAQTISKSLELKANILIKDDN